MATLGRSGGEKTGGRKKGVTNKDTAQLRDMILKALDKAGNDEYLYTQSQENPVAFMGLIGKILPKQVDVDANLTGKIAITEIRRVIINADNK